MKYLWIGIIFIYACSPPKSKPQTSSTDTFTKASQAYWEKGIALRRLDQFDSARYYQNQSIKEALKENDSAQYARALNELTLLSLYVGNTEEADKSNILELQVTTKIKDKHPDLYARSLHERGMIYFREYRDELARDSARKAWDIIEPIEKTDSLFLGLKCLISNSLGEFYKVLGEVENARHFLKLSQEFALSIKDTFQLAINLKRQGQLALILGDYESGVDYHQQASQMMIPIYGEDHPNVGQVYRSLSDIYMQMGELRKALNFLEYTQKIFLDHEEKYYLTLHESFTAMGDIYREFGEYERAKPALKKAEIYAQKGSDQASTMSHLSDAYQSQVRLYLAQNNYDSSFYYLQKAQHIFTEHPEASPMAEARLNQAFADYWKQLNRDDKMSEYYTKCVEFYQKKFGDKSPQMAGIYQEWGDFYAQQEQPKEALRYYQKSLKANYYHFNQDSIHQNPPVNEAIDKLVAWQTLSQKGKMIYKLYKRDKQLGNLEKAFATSYLATQLADSIRRSFTDQNAKIKLSKQGKQVFEFSLDLAYQLYDLKQEPIYLEKALQISEMSKSALLLESLKDEEAKTFANIPESMLKEEKQLRLNIAYYKKLLLENESLSQEEKQALQKKKFAADLELDNLKKEIEEDYPEYYSLKYQGNPLKVASIQLKLQDNECFLAYFVGDESIFCLGITKEDVQITKSAKPSNFVQMVNQLRRGLANKDFVAYTQSAYDLHQLLLDQPIIHSTDKLIVISDDLLNYLPFEVLLQAPAEPKTKDYGQLAYLIKKHRIAYNYAAQLFLHDFKKKNKPKISNQYLGFAPDFAPQEKEEQPLVLLRNQLDQLLGAKYEVEQINQLARGNYYVGSQAHEAQFKAKAHEYAILHLATHAVIDEANPMNSCLIFSEDIPEQIQEDGLLYTYELYNMDLQADLVVLSACNTGFGQLQSGEGVVSLARGFRYAGCPNIVMSLWPAPDKSTSKVMIDFYDHLVQGKTKDEALHEAKISFLEQADAISANPYFWGSFVFIGNPEPINIQAPLAWYRQTWFLALVILVFALGTWQWYARRSKSVKV